MEDWLQCTPGMYFFGACARTHWSVSSHAKRFNVHYENMTLAAAKQQENFERLIRQHV